MSDFRIKFFPRDLWVGVFIGEREPDAYGWYRTIYICPVPMLVFSFDVRVENIIEETALMDHQSRRARQEANR